MSAEVPRLRTSERTAFKRCPARWKWAYVDGLKLRNERPGALWFGTGIHLALQERYKYRGTRRGKNILKVWRDYVGDEQAVIYDENFAEDPTAYYDARELGEAMLGAYLDRYGTDEKWFVVATEEAFEIPIPHPKDKTRPIVDYLSAFDLVALNQETDDSLWLWDHKTAKTISTKHLSLDDQAGSYWALATDMLAHKKLIQPGQKLDGILYNFLRKAKPDSRPTNSDGLALNKDGTVSKRQPTPNFLREEVWRTRAERRKQILKIQNEALWMEKIRSGELPLLKNPTKDCSWDCPFFQMCELHESGGEWKEFRDLAYIRSDPYADHYTGNHSA